MNADSQDGYTDGPRAPAMPVFAGQKRVGSGSSGIGRQTSSQGVRAASEMNHHVDKVDYTAGQTGSSSSSVRFVTCCQ